MSGFSPEWLALREPVDHRSRDGALAEHVSAHFADRPNIEVVDLGCGSGSNIRATYALLGPEQTWTLVDYDPRLLVAARQTLAGWADKTETTPDALILSKAGKRLTVRFRQADLNRDLDFALGEKPDLVTASALFDLCSAGFIQTFATALTERRAAFYTVLTYNGVQTWTPAHTDDTAFAAAFHAHQMTDKGFGASAGPKAPAALAAAFKACGYAVGEGDSPWRLGASDQQLITDLATGFAGAVRETGRVSQAAVETWLETRRTGAVVGHTDTLATPR